MVTIIESEAASVFIEESHDDFFDEQDTRDLYESHLIDLIKLEESDENNDDFSDEETYPHGKTMESH
jgi:hypothetical protein